DLARLANHNHKIAHINSSEFDTMTGKLRVKAYGVYKIMGTAAVLAIAFTGSTIAPAKAVTFVTDRAALDATDQVDWSAIGSVVGPVSDLFNPSDPSIFLPNSFEVTSQAGQSVGVAIPPTDLPDVTPPFVFQTSSGDAIETNFADGDFIVFTGLALGPPPSTGNSGPITLTFAEPVLGAGAQIAAGAVFEFDATLTAFDSEGQVLGSFTAPGTASEELDNSALFLGAVDEQPRIASLEFSSSLPTNAIGINQLDLVTDTTGASVPEPSLLLGLSVLAAFGYRYRRL
ncbi:MAG: hypothetical protein AAFR42_20885, partial [Cyanobacteria bacterium J06628_6]